MTALNITTALFLLIHCSVVLCGERQPSPQEMKKYKIYVEKLKKQQQHRMQTHRNAGKAKQVYLKISCIRKDGTCTEFHGAEHSKDFFTNDYLKNIQQTNQCKVSRKRCSRKNLLKVCDQRLTLSSFSYRNYLYKGFGKSLSKTERSKAIQELCCTGLACKQ